MKNNDTGKMIGKAVLPVLFSFTGRKLRYEIQEDKEMVDSIIFDLDGTLWDSSEGVTKAWNEAICEAGYDFRIKKEEIGQMMGLTVSEIADRIFSRLPAKERIPMLRKCFAKEVVVLGREGGRLMNGISEVLSELKKKYRLFIVSNCQDGYVQTFLEVHQMWEYFEDFMCAGDTGLTKGESNRVLIDQYHLKKAVYVGDTQGDKDSAREAGIEFIYARYGFGEVADYQYGIDCLRDLPGILEQVL